MKYILTSSQFEGQVLFEFNDLGLLVNYSLKEATLTERQQIWILERLPKELKKLQVVLGNSRSAQLKPIKINATFEKFWDRYNEKARSSKKKTLQKWNRMSQTQRDLAFDYIYQYERNLLGGTAKKYAETYLNAELWNN